MNDYLELHSLYHHGIKGQKWGVRRFQNEDGAAIKQPSKQKARKKNRPNTDNKLGGYKKNTGKVIAIAAGSAAVGAAAVGIAWYAKNKHDTQIMLEKRRASIEKAKATRASRKASGYYNNVFKNVDVVISKGSEFVKSYSGAKIVRVKP